MRALRFLTVLSSLGLSFLQQLDAGQTPKTPRPDAAVQEKARLLQSAGLAGDWLVNNQEKRTLGREPFSGDYGRWLYEYKTPDKFWRASSCWTTGTGIMALALLHERTGQARYKDAIDRAARYLKSLQVMDSRDPRTFGTLHELNPLSGYIFPRDGSTGGIGGYLALYRITGDKDYLERAQLYADWFLKNAINPNTGWPAWAFSLEGKLGIDPGDSRAAAWQAGSGIFFYHLYKTTGNRVYFDKGVLPLADGLVKNAYQKGGIETFYSAGGHLETKANNDDFANLTLLAAYRETGDKRYWEIAIRRLENLMSSQREDGALVPGNTAGLFVTGLTALDAIELAAEKKQEIDKDRLEKMVRRIAAFAPSLQETDPAEVKAFGGYYCQLNLADFRREWIHARATTYSIIFNLRYEGVVKAPFYSVFGWE